MRVGAMIPSHNENLRIEADKPLASLTSMGVGGAAQYYTVVETNDELARALVWAEARTLPSRILSGGSNLIIADEGVTGLVVDIRLRGMKFEPADDNTVLATAFAGQDWDAFVAETVRRGYCGLECLSGIPGRVGSTPIQNVGAYGQDVSQTICDVVVLDRESGHIATVPADDCEFGYRTSRFKHRQADRFVVLSVCFRLKATTPTLSNHAELAQQLARVNGVTALDVREAVLSLRKSKSMLLDATDPFARSCGSFFVNPVIPSADGDALRHRFAPERVPLYPQASGAKKVAAAWLIEKAGFRRGFNDGCVGLSEKHSLAIVARPGATAREVVRLARNIQSAVADAFDIRLVPEPVFWGYVRMTLGLPAIDGQ